VIYNKFRSRAGTEGTATHRSKRRNRALNDETDCLPRAVSRELRFK